MAQEYITLPARLEAEQFCELRDKLLQLDVAGPVLLNAAEVSQCTTPYFQLLLGALQFQENGAPRFKLTNIPASLRAAWTDFGLTSLHALEA